MTYAVATQAAFCMLKARYYVNMLKPFIVHTIIEYNVNLSTKETFFDFYEIKYGQGVIKYNINFNGFIKFDHAPTVNDQQRRSIVTCTTTRRKPLPRDAIKCKYLHLLRILMKSERIQMVTNETESCYTCESICMPIKLLIKHTMYYKAIQTPNIVFEAGGADPSKNSLQAKKSNFPK